MEKAIIFLNGEQPRSDSVAKIDFDKVFVICADGAYDYALEFCVPDLLIGDFDSLQDVGSVNALNVERFPVGKNHTDAQLAVRRAVELGFRCIDIYGAFGLRPDHALVNYSLLALAHSLNASAVLRGGDFDVHFVTPERPFAGAVEKDKIVSLVPYSDSVHILYTKGLRYKAENVCVDKTEIFTTSNTSCCGEIEYRLKFGTALLFVEN